MTYLPGATALTIHCQNDSSERPQTDVLIAIKDLNWFDLIWLKLNWFDLIWFELHWLESIWETSGRHLGDIWAPREHPGDTQHAPRRHPGGTQEASRRHPGGTQGHPGHRQSPRGLGSKKVNTSQLKCKRNWKINKIHEACLKVGVTKYRAWRQNPRKGRITKGSLSKPPEPLRWNLFGELIWII